MRSMTRDTSALLGWCVLAALAFAFLATPTRAMTSSAVNTAGMLSPRAERQQARAVADAALKYNRQFTTNARAYRQFAIHTRFYCRPVYKPGTFVGCTAPVWTNAGRQDDDYAGLVWYDSQTVSLETGP
jgi:hypothetical protein